MQSQLQAAGIQNLTWSVREFSQNNLRLQDVAFEYTLPEQSVAVNFSSREIIIRYQWQSRPWLSVPRVEAVTLVNPHVVLPNTPAELFMAAREHTPQTTNKNALTAELDNILNANEWQLWLTTPDRPAPLNYAAIKQLVTEIPYLATDWQLALDHFQLSFPCTAVYSARASNRTQQFCHFILNTDIHFDAAESADLHLQLQAHTSADLSSVALVSQAPWLELQLMTLPEQDFLIAIDWQQPQLFSAPVSLQLTPNAIDLSLSWSQNLASWTQHHTPLHDVFTQWHLSAFTTNTADNPNHQPGELIFRRLQDSFATLPSWLTTTTTNLALSASIPWLHADSVPNLSVSASISSQLADASHSDLHFNWVAHSVANNLSDAHELMSEKATINSQLQFELQLNGAATDINAALDLPISAAGPVKLNVLGRSDSLPWQSVWQQFADQMGGSLQSGLQNDALEQQVKLDLLSLLTDAFEDANLALEVASEPLLLNATQLAPTSIEAHSAFSLAFADLWQLLRGERQPVPIHFTQPLRVTAATESMRLDDETTAHEVTSIAVIDELTLNTAELLQSQFYARINVATANIEHLALLPQDWQFSFNLSHAYGQQQSNLSGLVTNQAGLALQLDSNLDLHEITEPTAATILSVDWLLEDIFLIAGNPLSRTVRDWPELLTLERGRIQANGQLQLPLGADHGSNQGFHPNADNEYNFRVNGSVQLSDLVGIYDTAAFRGLNTALQFSISSNELMVSTEQLRLLSLQQGFNIGPLEAKFDYYATLDALTEGRIILHDNQIHLFDGLVRLSNQTYDLQDSSLILPVELHALNLTTLLTQYPVTDFNGSGLLSGVVPVRLTERGFSVANGAITALPPGGALRYHSEQFAGFAATNRSMQTLLGILEDFHYDLLSGTVSYDEDGTLELHLSLHGQNPSVESGRPVHLNVVLQENLPALIASMQLTNQVNKVIEERLQRRLLRQN
ncbi:MAG: YdbH domain-containing protein [Gammaproteobacteria bacterium]|nr:YdbH domain-containing protein [Gammaproteobacteria bacterium]